MSDVHVMPINDLYPHHDSDGCPCNPKRDLEEADVVIHNAFDGRDFYEDESNE